MTTKKPEIASIAIRPHGRLETALYALEGLPTGGWPETARALQELDNELPHGVSAYEFARYHLDGSGSHWRRR